MQTTQKADDRWKFIHELDEEYLKGGVILSEWCVFIVRSADLAFASGAFLATILTAAAGIEAYLRSQQATSSASTLFQLIAGSELDQGHIEELHAIRRYRNRWVHVANPCDDASLINEPEKLESELEEMSARAVRVLRKTIYSDQWV